MNRIGALSAGRGRQVANRGIDYLSSSDGDTRPYVDPEDAETDPTRSDPPPYLARLSPLVLMRTAMERLPRSPLAGAGRAGAASVEEAAERRSVVTSSPGYQHLPLRPLWIYRRCAAPWPCATARLHLLAEYAHDQPALAIYLATLLHEATADLCRLNPEPGPNPADLHARFVGWTRYEPR